MLWRLIPGETMHLISIDPPLGGGSVWPLNFTQLLLGPGNAHYKHGTPAITEKVPGSLFSPDPDVFALLQPAPAGKKYVDSFSRKQGYLKVGILQFE
ncbi:hypothetical protein SAMN04487894_11875 [Niabella drilacis]|uniref:Uncharacterized protein n=1 Tax=Niabella drilacis (strain DSM 25811 / CCM 8410 / CCUG 62505 / LMG 26954 / E90) TaxID=1285928 RepID=A0A1G6ZJG8_NIADE|nr:hypothetical protein SAMN04487894_11875 [Niabella drilacis]